MAEQSPETDESVAARVQDGDAEAFGILVERYEAGMLRYARKFLFGYEDAKDMVQEVFIKAYANINSFDAERKFSAWLYRIAHNEFINAIKKKGREPLSFFDPDTIFPHPSTPSTAEGDMQRKETAALMESSLGRLDPKYREPLVLYYFEEMDYREISEIMRIPVSTVGVRIRRAKQQLHKDIEDPEAKPKNSAQSAQQK